MNRRQIINSILIVFILALISYPIAFATEASDTVTVNVNISSVAAITVNPISISWIGVNPGADSSTTNILITNTGSVNVSGVYITSSTITDESTNPLPTGNVDAYSSTSLIFVKNTTESEYSHIGRLEWNLSPTRTDERVDLEAGTTNYSHGWYRNSSGNEYIWKVENGTDGYCNESGTVFEIQTVPENFTSTSRDLTSPGTLSSCSAVTVGADWGIFTCSDGPLDRYCIAAAETCDKIYIYKQDYSTTFPTCAKREYLMSEVLVPTAETSISVFASIPYGLPAGDTNAGTLTIVANS